MALLTSWLVPCPLLRQGQAEVEHGVVVAGDVAHAHTDLAVVDLPPMATPLAFHPHRVHAAFGETAGIKRDHAIGFPQPLDHVGDQDLDQRAVIPGGGTEEVLENLSLDIDERRDVLGILPGQVGQEPLEVEVDVALAGLGLQRSLIGHHEVAQPLHHGGEHVGGHDTVTPQCLSPLCPRGCHLFASSQ